MSTMVDQIVPRGVMRFANVAARSAAVPSPVAGMTSWLISELRLDIHDGTAWRTYSPAGTWTTYVPTWTSRGGNGVQPTLGNGILTSRWIKQDRRVTWRGKLKYGSLSTSGDGYWYMSLPVPAASTGMVIIGIASYVMLGSNNFLGSTLLGVNDTAVGFVTSQLGSDYTANVSGTLPVNASSSVELSWSIEYESAS
ncbi:hypothetical protein [Kitasatospora sp. NPDC101183]|uniref:hypothetical protein n=1 Tax=Kitasatospora sp. NPDC101183 TaxID=3364100 RepID=UPI0037FDA2EB